MKWATLDELLQSVIKNQQECPDFGLDDSLWCYAYEPNCQKLRQLVYKECGVKDKLGLIDWDNAHSPDERLALLHSLAQSQPVGEKDE